MKSNHRNGFAIAHALIACTVVTVTSAQAHTFCVNTSTKLRNALVAASDGGANNHENNTIQVVRGTYAVGGTQFSFASTDPHTLDINGGYDQDCSSLVENPALTILDGGNTSRVLSTTSTQGDVSLRFLTFQNGAAGASSDGGALAMNFDNTDDGPVIVDQNIFRNNHATFSGGCSIAVNGSGTLQFENNLVVDNVADITDGGCDIVDDGNGVTIINNTFAKNIANGPGVETGGLALAELIPAVDTMSNNIFWGNVGDDLDTSAILVNNDFSTNYNTTGAGSVGNVNLDPKFFGAADYRLSADSPLRGMGILTPVGGLPVIDIVGLARQYATHVDMGAYEFGDAIYINDFDQ